MQHDVASSTMIGESPRLKLIVLVVSLLHQHPLPSISSGRLEDGEDEDPAELQQVLENTKKKSKRGRTFYNRTLSSWIDHICYSAVLIVTICARKVGATYSS